MSKRASTFVVATPDAGSAAHVASLLAAGGIDEIVTVTGGRRPSGLEKRLADPRRAPVLVAVPSQKTGSDLLALADIVSAAGGATLVWGDREAHKTASGPHWLATILLEQRGAIHVRSLPVLVEICRILHHLGIPDSPGVAVAGQAGELKRRLRDVLAGRGVRILPRRSKASLSIEASARGRLKIGLGSRAMKISACDIAAIAASLAPGTMPSRQLPGPAPGPPQTDSEVVSLIAQPPARLLSETTSKKLAAAFGMRIPEEHLCGSSSEAARAFSTAGGAVFLKLVRPRLEGKLAAGAVLGPLDSAPAVRRAYHSLEELGATLAPPRHLGVLVSPALTGDARIWLVMKDHEIYGRILLGGPGDRPDSRPAFALTADATFGQAFDALSRAGVEMDGGQHMALAGELWRFASMVEALGGAITRAEAHPVLALPSGEALSADMLISIAG